MMDVRNAILAAADQIEKNPQSFNFISNNVPNNRCGSPGCALGWIGAFADNENARDFFGEPCKYWESPTPISKYLLQAGDTEDFYNRMDRLGGILFFNRRDWRDNAIECAKRLRLYADKYHPAEPSKELKSGAEICRDIIRKPYREQVEA